MLICYLGKEEKEFFRIFKGKIEKLSEKEIKKWVYFFEKKVVILSRELVFHIKKSFPLVERKELKKMISFEVEEISPYKDFGYYYRIGEIGKTFMEVDFWFWEIKVLESLKEKGFLFSHVIPEDLVFSGQKGSLFVSFKKDKTYLIAYKENFLNSTLCSFPLEEECLALFLKTLKEKEINQVIIYGKKEDFPEEVFKKVFERGFPILTYKKSLIEDLPYFLEKISLKSFKIKKITSYEELILKGLRIAFLATLAIIFNLYISGRSYDKAKEEVIAKIKKLSEEEKRGSLIYKKEFSKEEFSQKLSEFKDELKSKENERIKDVVFLMDELAKILPDESYIRTFELKEKKLNLYITAKDVIEIIKGLRKLEMVKEVKLGSAPIFDPSKKVYSFRVEITLK